MEGEGEGEGPEGEKSKKGPPGARQTPLTCVLRYYLY